MNALKSKYIFKVIVVGEGGVGKTTLVNRYASGKFSEDTKLTVGASFYTFENKVNGDTSVKLQIWDFGGEKRFRFILPSYTRGAHGVIFAFDLTRSTTLFNLEEWFELIKENADSPIFLLIGTKADKIEEAGIEAVNTEQITEFMKTYDLSSKLFLRTSSKTGENIENVFTTLSDLLYRRVNLQDE
jgi:Ras-related protein Rab-1A